jgi:hypothetical protein
VQKLESKFAGPVSTISIEAKIKETRARESANKKSPPQSGGVLKISP